MSHVITPVTERLRQVQSRIRRLFFLDGLVRVALVLCAFVTVTFVVDFALRLPSTVRLIALAAGAVWAGWTAWERIVYPLRVRIHPDDLVLMLEQEYPDLNDRLISAVQLSRKGGAAAGENYSPQLVDLLVEDAVAASRNLSFERIVVGRRVAMLAGGMLCFAGVLAGLSFAVPEYSSIYFKRVIGMETRWPQVTYLKVLDFEEGKPRVVARGSDLEINVEVLRGRPKEVWIEYTYDHAEKGRVETKLKDGIYKGTFDRVLGPFVFKVHGGDAVTDTYRVETLNPPVVDRLRYWYTYPAYTGKSGTPLDAPEVSGNIVAPVYTSVAFEVTSNEDVESGTLIVGTGRKGEEKKVSMARQNDAAGHPRLLRGTFEIKDDYVDYQILIRATNTLDNSKGIIRYAIKPIIDQPPVIRPLDPVSDEDVTENARRPLTVQTTDDYGVAEVKMVYRVSASGSDAGEQEKKFGTDENIPPDYGGTSVRSQYEFDISKLGVKPGDFIVYRYVAADYKNIGGKNINKSPDMRFRVISQAEMEKSLEAMINEIKRGLEAQKHEEDKLRRQSGEVEKKYGTQEVLTPEQRSEVKTLALKQNSVTHAVERHRKGVEKVLKMGTYNRIFDAAATRKLNNVLNFLTGIVGQENRPGKSEQSGQLLQTATNVRDARQRSRALQDAERIQGDIVTDIGKSLELLEDWSNYQEVVRRIRDLHRNQKDQNDQIRQTAGSGPDKKEDNKKEEKNR